MKRLDTIGTVTKKEKLATFESPVLLSELVLEEIEPFPGYYDPYHSPVGKGKITRHLYLMTRDLDFFNDDEIIRATYRIKLAMPQFFDAKLGQLYLFNELTNCIRIHTHYPEIIPDLIQAYKDTGIHFIKTRIVKSYESLIKVKTFFQLSEIEEGIFRHVRKSEIHYLVIPAKISWNDFERLTLSIRQNSDYKLYDAALASAYTFNGMVEMVRIYDKSASLTNLITLREKYTRNIVGY